MQGLKNKIRMNPYLRWLLIFSNWLIQGIPHLHKTEKIYRASFTILFTSIIFVLLLLESHLGLIASLAVAFICAHTFNWIINSNFSILIIHRLFLAKLDKSIVFHYLNDLASRIDKQQSIKFAAVYGSISRGLLKQSSDIDMAMVRKEGFINAIKALIFVVTERKIADWQRIPLELYLMDNFDEVSQRFRNENVPVLIYDSMNIAKLNYSKTITVGQAFKLNNVELR